MQRQLLKALHSFPLPEARQQASQKQNPVTPASEPAIQPATYQPVSAALQALVQLANNVRHVPPLLARMHCRLECCSSGQKQGARHVGQLLTRLRQEGPAPGTAGLPPARPPNMLSIEDCCSRGSEPE